VTRIFIYLYLPFMLIKLKNHMFKMSEFNMLNNNLHFTVYILSRITKFLRFTRNSSYKIMFHVRKHISELRIRLYVPGFKRVLNIKDGNLSILMKLGMNITPFENKSSRYFLNPRRQQYHREYYANYEEATTLSHFSSHRVLYCIRSLKSAL
jgi:hypothetical protein